ncbi:DUF883 family protein [Legionella cincinnatiensis]|uniref:Bacterial protein of uncharacterized function (DUF883) n=1 Tax=Legionella cincinnatiensis TaxID=28085 RepID=A0A378IJY2_9GAMM|nr:hypothetical protein [Legionella cincinnatiensis]KTC78772.1 hypothetical protein Lcin_3387 [Legionella cincinnatiensis]STX35366.1 Bacterial protein of uncharacterised function (DUF883) [Legionella cincinnatiensis]
MNDFNDNAKDIKKKASELYKTAKENTKNAYYETKPKAEELVAQFGTTASDLYASGKKEVECAEKYVQESVKSISHSIQKQPLTSVLIAAGIGFLFAKFFKID